jgi:hypothetical protein
MEEKKEDASNLYTFSYTQLKDLQKIIAQYMSRNNETRFLSGKLRLHMQAMFNTFSLPNVLEIPRSDKTTSTNIDVSLSKPKPSKTKSTNNLTLVHWQKNMDELFTTCTPAIYILYK